MKVNEYELMDEPTDEQLEAYRRVRYYYTQRQVVEFLEHTAPEPLEQHEFNTVVHFAWATDMKRPADSEYISALYLSELRDRKTNSMK